MSAELHTLIIYVVFGFSLLFPAVLACIKLLSITHPLQRLQLYLFALITPPAGFILYHTLLTKRCQAGAMPHGAGGEAFYMLCNFSGSLLPFILPLLGTLVGLGLLKAAAAWLLINRLRARSAFPGESAVKRVESLLKERCGNLNIRQPEVLYSAHSGHTAYTAGIIRPILVLDRDLAGQLNDRELDAVISHELVHIRGWDTLKGWLLQLVRDVTFFNPLSSVLLGRFFLERECLCDREALRLTGMAPRAYAAALLKVWRIQLNLRPVRPGLASAFTGRGRQMEYRIGSLLQRFGQRPMAALPFYTLMFCLFAASIIFLGLIC